MRAIPSDADKRILYDFLRTIDNLEVFARLDEPEPANLITTVGNFRTIARFCKLDGVQRKVAALVEFICSTARFPGSLSVST
jgi:hypothetical protein